MDDTDTFSDTTLRDEMVLVNEETAKIFQARRLLKNADPALTFNEEIKPPFKISLDAILTEEIAGSYDQSAIDERLEVVAIGTPFNNSSVPPTTVSSAPSIKTPAVAKIVDVFKSCMSALPDEM
jgi:hypothetical protein